MKHKKKGRFAKKIIATVIMLNIIFTVAILLCFWHTGSEPASLVVSFFGFTTVELWSLAKIKRDKLKEERMSEDEQQQIS